MAGIDLRRDLEFVVERLTGGKVGEAVRAFYDIAAKEEGPALAGILFAGDRAMVDEAVVAKKDGELIGIATMAFSGYGGASEPYIVALYVKRSFRNRGVGTALLQEAIQVMVEMGLTPVRIEVLTPASARVVEKLPPGYLSHLAPIMAVTLLPGITGFPDEEAKG